MKRILFSLLLIACCAGISHANKITLINMTGCDFTVSFVVNTPVATSTTVTIPASNTTVYNNPGIVPATWTPTLTPAQLAVATFIYLTASPVSNPTTTFLLRAGGGYNSQAAGFFPACSPAGFIGSWFVNSSGDVVVLLS